MSRHRRWLVCGVIAAVIGGSLYDIMTDCEHWPFSPYPMYSDVRREYVLKRFWLFGIEKETGREMSLLDAQYVQPFDRSRLTHALMRIYRGQVDRQPLLSRALQDCWVRYEALRRAGRHHGPPLSGVQLYLMTWQLASSGHQAEQQASRELLAEVTDSTDSGE